MGASSQRCQAPQARQAPSSEEALGQARRGRSPRRASLKRSATSLLLRPGLSRMGQLSHAAREVYSPSSRTSVAARARAVGRGRPRCLSSLAALWRVPLGSRPLCCTRGCRDMVDALLVRSWQEWKRCRRNSGVRGCCHEICAQSMMATNVVALSSPCFGGPSFALRNCFRSSHP
eukprot:3633211-Pyramimonas_sp.AAC.1